VIRHLVAVACLGASLLACAINEHHVENIVIPARPQSETVTCNSPFVNPDLSTLKPCGDGKGHCYAGAKTSIPNLPKCDGDDVCLPDKVLAANGAKLKSCTFMIDAKPGACVSLLIADIAAHASALQPDVCDPAIERCAPCISPIDGTDTHLCEETGVHTEACVGGPGAKQDTCCHGAGVCMTKEGVPSDQRDALHHDTCKDDKVCAPAALVDGNPTRCHAFADPGVCVDVCFAAQLVPAAQVMRSVCGPTEVCVPCIVGKGQGMPGC